MGDFGLLEIIMLLLIGIVVFGGDLPAAGRKLGRLWGKVQSYLDLIKQSLREEQRNIRENMDIEPPDPDDRYNFPEPPSEDSGSTTVGTDENADPAEDSTEAAGPDEPTDSSPPSNPDQ